MQASNEWKAEALWEQLAAQCPGLTVEVVADLPSTNTTLMERARAGHAEPCLLVAECQTAGRGRMGRHWLAHPGDSLTMSLGLPMAPTSWSGLSLVVGVALAQALDPRIRLKWPNDLWLLDGQGAGSKLGGILIETATLPDGLRWVVIGVGLNVRPLPPPVEALAVPAAALMQLDPAWTAERALHCVAQPLLSAVQAFEQQGWQPWAERFAARDALAGRQVDVIAAEGTTRSGVARGVTNEGGLRVETPTGVQVVTSAEVSVRPC